MPAVPKKRLQLLEPGLLGKQAPWGRKGALHLREQSLWEQDLPITAGEVVAEWVGAMVSVMTARKLLELGPTVCWRQKAAERDSKLSETHYSHFHVVSSEIHVLPSLQC